MSQPKSSLSGQLRKDLIERFMPRKPGPETSAEPIRQPATPSSASNIPDAFCRFSAFPDYKKLLVPQAAAKQMGVANPFFKIHEGSAGATTEIAGRSYINFSSYNYLGLSGDPRVNKAAQDAITRYGTSVSASRLVAGERPVQRELEEALAEFYGVEDAIVFVSGHATNMATIGYLFGPKDLVIHDSLIHNSVMEGIKLSGAARRSFPHNDASVLESILAEIRGQFERVLIVIEGLYSMDGDTPELPAFIDIKNRYKAFLMVDEAHSLGVVGQTGGGMREHFGIAGSAVDIWMGTLSKSLAGCGGYICGERALIEQLKYAAPGFVYSVGISPPLAAASLAALRILQAEPERVATLQRRTKEFQSMLQERGIDTGLAQGYAIIPVITKNSLKAVKLSNKLFERGFNVQPIIHPAVEERAARLRFFISCMHSQEQLRKMVEALLDLL